MTTLTHTNSNDSISSQPKGFSKSEHGKATEITPLKIGSQDQRPQPITGCGNILISCCLFFCVDVRKLKTKEGREAAQICSASRA